MQINLKTRRIWTGILIFAGFLLIAIFVGCMFYDMWAHSLPGDR